VTTTLPEDQRLQQISARAFEHPADRAATAALQRIPMLDVVVRKLIELGYESAYRGSVTAGALRIGERQLPEAWADHVAAYARLDIKPVPHLFISQVPFTNAAAIGARNPMVVVHSRTIELLDRAELRTVLAHEAGHVLADHVLYQTALNILLSLSGLGRLGMLMGLPLLGVRLALLEWFRAAELSADRAATLVNRDPLVTCRTLMVMAAGLPSTQLNLDAFLEQGRAYREVEGFEKFRRISSELNLTHARPVKRAHEIMTWVQSGEYDRIVDGDYIRRGSEPGFREEADAATEHYSERFRTLFREAGESMTKVGDQLADATEKASGAASDAVDRFSEWLRAGRDRDG
jgi:Zn-dependent protease with chaperone function